MKRLYIGNTTSDTDQRVTKLAEENNTVNHGLVTCANDILQDGFYHSTVIDISPAEISKIDCDILLLDQPKESYSTLQEYYQSKKIVDNKDSYWEQLIKNNKSFCIFPFINHSMSFENTTLCCRSREVVTKTKDFNWNSSLQDIRTKMLQGKKINHCSICYNEEELGRLSARQSETVNWVHKLDISSVENLKFEKPIMYDIEPNNTCNLMCRMCSSEYSVLIQREQNDTNKFQTTDWEYIDLDQAQVVYISGGEPLAMQDFQKFLKRCENENRLDLEIRINTNANKISNRFFENLSKFQNIVFTVSIDGYGKANDYQRWLSEWDNICSNIQKIYDKGHSVNFNITLSIYTIFSFADLLYYLNKNYPRHIVNISFAKFKNDILDPFVFKYDDRLLNKLATISNLDIYHNNYILKTFVQDLIRRAKTSSVNVEKLKKFFEYNDNLDKLRNSRLIDYIPELEEKRQIIGVDNG